MVINHPPTIIILTSILILITTRLPAPALQGLAWPNTSELLCMTSPHKPGICHLGHKSMNYIIIAVSIFDSHHHCILWGRWPSMSAIWSTMFKVTIFRVLDGRCLFNAEFTIWAHHCLTTTNIWSRSSQYSRSTNHSIKPHFVRSACQCSVGVNCQQTFRSSSDHWHHWPNTQLSDSVHIFPVGNKLFHCIWGTAGPVAFARTSSQLNAVSTRGESKSGPSCC